MHAWHARAVVDEVMRDSGRATISRDPALLAGMAVNGMRRSPPSSLRSTRAFFHCGKALRRAGLWDPARQIDRKAFPSRAPVIHTRRPHEPLEKIEKFIAASYRNELLWTEVHGLVKLHTRGGRRVEILPRGCGRATTAASPAACT